ncbi:MAG: AmmeMemoRadiSam system radical SAM enzyme [Verrucomicrobiae bacterium]|nr:AmmeMemoRadiSam system radical SAM enzyme [Verrucomicrobiae bacterium]
MVQETPPFVTDPRSLRERRGGKPPAGLNRRQAICCGLAGAATLAGVGGWLRNLFFKGGDIGTVFKGDAPKGELWELWKRRGWVREAMHYIKLGRNVQCTICPNNCLLEPEDRSHCRTKVNKDGTLYTLAYGNPCSLHVDPIEKKPLYHFYPGSRSFSLATAGCVLRCLNCQNWDISQRKPEDTKDAKAPELRLRPPLPSGLRPVDVARLSLFPEDLVAVAQATGCASISYTYTEPIAYYEYTYDSCRLARAAGVKNVLVTCGSIEERPLRDLAQYVDGAHVDLKGFDDAVYRKLNSGKLQTVLNAIVTLKSMSVWVEVINLIVPTYTDRLDVIRRMCDWLAKHAGVDTPLHFSRFHPQHKLTHLPPTPVEILQQARDVARAAGLRYVYIGNVVGVPDSGTTFCPSCRSAVIERDIFAVTANRLVDGKCPKCHTAIAGIWG